MPESPPPSQSLDSHIGVRLRLRRVLRGLSQSALGEAVGVSPQQIQKYERGQSRIPAARLFRLAAALAVPVDDFFRYLHGPQALEPRGETLPPCYRDPVQAEETRALIEAFIGLSEQDRHTVLDLLNTLAVRRL